MLDISLEHLFNQKIVFFLLLVLEVSETAWFYLAFCSFFQDKPFYLRWRQNYLYQTFELRYQDFRKDFSKTPIPFCSSFLQVYYVSIYDGNIGPVLLIYF